MPTRPALSGSTSQCVHAACSSGVWHATGSSSIPCTPRLSIPLHRSPVARQTSPADCHTRQRTVRMDIAKRQTREGELGKYLVTLIPTATTGGLNKAASVRTRPPESARSRQIHPRALLAAILLHIAGILLSLRTYQVFEPTTPPVIAVTLAFAATPAGSTTNSPPVPSSDSSAVSAPAADPPPELTEPAPAAPVPPAATQHTVDEPARDVPTEAPPEAALPIPPVASEPAPPTELVSPPVVPPIGPTFHPQAKSLLRQPKPRSSGPVQGPQPATQPPRDRPSAPAAPASSAGTADPSSTAAGADSRSWKGELSAWLQAHKSYPAPARERGEEGTVSVTFVVARDGRVLNVVADRSSGFAVLDRAATAMLRDARLPPFSAAMPQAQMTVSVALRYTLER